MGDKAKLFRNHDLAIENKNKEITRLESEIADLKQKLQAAQGSTGSGSGSPARRVGALVE